MNIQQLLEKLDTYLYQMKERIIYLYEMSQPQAQVRQRFRDLSEEIILHLIKIILYGNEESNTVGHWCSEIDAWLDKCMRNKIKKNGVDRYPNEQEILTWLTDYYKTASDIEGLRFAVEKEYSYQGHQKRQSISDEVLYKNILAILTELSPMVANKTHDKNSIKEISQRYVLG